MENSVLWNPTDQRKESSQMARFLKHIENIHGAKFNNYQELHKWSVENPGQFWGDLAYFYNITFEGNRGPVHKDLSFLDYPWFPKAKINFAKNLLRHKNRTTVALNSQHESGVLRTINYEQLYSYTFQMQDYLKDYVSKGDVVAAYMPNISETVISMLATSSLGAIFTSTSCDFGVQGVLDRFGQTKPKVLVTVNGYSYNGKFFDLTDRIKEIKESIPSIEKVIIVDFLGKNFKVTEDWMELYSDIEKAEMPDDAEIEFTAVDFNHPLYIMYSSGTTGKPKCIVHSHGGTLIQHVKELGLHTDLTGDKNIFYFTTCGWMMWNWLVSSLFFGAQITLFEGSPASVNLLNFIHMIDREKINIFGTSPKFLKALEDTIGEDLKSSFESLETVLTTGSPLLPEQFEYVYLSLKRDILLASICGGTDIISCFMLGNPILPVREGEIQAPGLGMNIAAFNNKGKAVYGEQGELVCLTPFMSQPIGFWNDENKEKFKAAYFNVYENIWHHGDFITMSEKLGVVVHGRSDATLNPGGVRIGTAEIYRQTERLEYLEDSVCVGKKVNGDVDVILYVKMNPKQELDAEKIAEIKKEIKENTTPRHTPKEIIAVGGIPYTRSGKKMEVAVTRLINGEELTNIEAVSNPECLEEYK